MGTSEANENRLEKCEDLQSQYGPALTIASEA